MKNFLRGVFLSMFSCTLLLVVASQVEAACRACRGGLFQRMRENRQERREQRQQYGLVSWWRNGCSSGTCSPNYEQYSQSPPEPPIADAANPIGNKCKCGCGCTNCKCGGKKSEPAEKKPAIEAEPPMLGTNEPEASVLGISQGKVRASRPFAKIEDGEPAKHWVSDPPHLLEM